MKGSHAAAAVGIVAALAAVALSLRSRAPRLEIGAYFRGDVRSPYLHADDVCMRVVAIDARRVIGRIVDRRFPGMLGVDVAVALDDVTAIGGAECPPRTTAATWTPIHEDRVMLRRDVRYRACVKIPALVPNALVRDKIRPGLEAKGFRDVAVTETRPVPPWSRDACDFYVEATWDREDLELDRPGAVVAAWRES